jgi:hypothetical protein
MALNHVQRSDAVAAHSRAKRGFSGGIYMRSALGFIAAGVLVALTMDMAVADGARRSWRVYRHGIGAISRDVITPWYVGYYPSHYSYFSPRSHASCAGPCSGLLALGFWISLLGLLVAGRHSAMDERANFGVLLPALAAEKRCSPAR